MNSLKKILTISAVLGLALAVKAGATGPNPNFAWWEKQAILNEVAKKAGNSTCPLKSFQDANNALLKMKSINKTWGREVGNMSENPVCIYSINDLENSLEAFPNPWVLHINFDLINEDNELRPLMIRLKTLGLPIFIHGSVATFFNKPMYLDVLKDQIIGFEGNIPPRGNAPVIYWLKKCKNLKFVKINRVTTLALRKLKEELVDFEEFKDILPESEGSLALASLHKINITWDIEKKIDQMGDTSTKEIEEINEKIKDFLKTRINLEWVLVKEAQEMKCPPNTEKIIINQSADMQLILANAMKKIQDCVIMKVAFYIFYIRNNHDLVVPPFPELPDCVKSLTIKINNNNKNIIGKIAVSSNGVEKLKLRVPHDWCNFLRCTYELPELSPKHFDLNLPNLKTVELDWNLKPRNASENIVISNVKPKLEEISKKKITSYEYNDIHKKFIFNLK